MGAAHELSAESFASKSQANPAGSDAGPPESNRGLLSFFSSGTAGKAEAPAPAAPAASAASAVAAAGKLTVPGGTFNEPSPPLPPAPRLDPPNHWGLDLLMACRGGQAASLIEATLARYVSRPPPPPLGCSPAAASACATDAALAASVGADRNLGSPTHGSHLAHLRGGLTPQSGQALATARGGGALGGLRGFGGAVAGALRAAVVALVALPLMPFVKVEIETSIHSSR